MLRRKGVEVMGKMPVEQMIETVTVVRLCYLKRIPARVYIDVR